MRAVRYSEYGGPEVLQVDEVDEPHAGPGQIRVAVKAAGVNPIDWKVRGGMMAGGAPLEAPRIIGSDASGVVDEVGDGVTDVAVGDAVFGSGPGGATAEFAVLASYAVKPDALGWAEAAGLPVPVETAARGLDLLGLAEGQTLLLNGAAGGVGIAVIQLARARGASVIGTASQANHDFLRELGAEPTTYGDGLVDRVRELAPDGVDLAYDAAGHGALPALIELTGSPDNVITIADFSAPQLGVRVTTGGGDRAWYALAQAAELFEQGRFAMPVAQAFPFEQAGDAHRLSADGHVRGKLVIVPEVVADDR
jgi:NADPH:quinone reductase-like Zn-dependent oxidoreductase